eukprot:CAMPEP_0173469506 /NCGR_PEP_ID=MMETSP1357-20121228/77396_1 /TAXON_ID=77926 /ORGANISM="Hemiselmis rufescens, Strain PCC563" /LENGTH=58 /DNA_ID=CAMNT_0014437751 /DNA_START=1452 /DNA_END=1628 /DNA_ORIENTATION=+
MNTLPLPLATYFESGENATELTLAACPLSVHTSCLVFASQILTVLSSLAEAIRVPSGE